MVDVNAEPCASTLMEKKNGASCVTWHFFNPTDIRTKLEPWHEGISYPIYLFIYLFMYFFSNIICIYIYMSTYVMFIFKHTHTHTLDIANLFFFDCVPKVFVGLIVRDPGN